MTESPSTCWIQIREAAAGDVDQRDAFVQRYSPALRAYLTARWRSSAAMTELEDALQEVFLECVRDNGVLARAEPGGAGSFRAYLYGVVRNVARRFEQRRRERNERQTSPSHLVTQEADEPTLSRAFDQEFARTIMREAGVRQRQFAEAHGDKALRRVQLLERRVAEGTPIRVIAEDWNVDAAELHHEYATARKEFRQALLEVMQFYHPNAPGRAQQEAEELIQLLAEK